MRSSEPAGIPRPVRGLAMIIPDVCSGLKCAQQVGAKMLFRFYLYMISSFEFLSLAILNSRSLYITFEKPEFGHCFLLNVESRGEPGGSPRLCL